MHLKSILQKQLCVVILTVSVMDFLIWFVVSKWIIAYARATRSRELTILQIANNKFVMI